MAATASISAFRGWVPISVLLADCGATASLATAAARAIPALLTGGSIGIDLLRPSVECGDLPGAALTLALLVLVLLRNGWRARVLCRLLTRDDASTTDLAYGAISTTGVMMLLPVVLTRGIDALGDSGAGLWLCADLPFPGILFVHSSGIYWVYRLMHTSWFWHLHALHHAAEDFNVGGSAAAAPGGS